VTAENATITSAISSVSQGLSSQHQTQQKLSLVHLPSKSKVAKNPEHNLIDVDYIIDHNKRRLAHLAAGVSKFAGDAWKKVSAAWKAFLYYAAEVKYMVLKALIAVSFIDILQEGWIKIRGEDPNGAVAAFFLKATALLFIQSKLELDAEQREATAIVDVSATSSSSTGQHEYGSEDDDFDDLGDGPDDVNAMEIKELL